MYSISGAYFKDNLRDQEMNLQELTIAELELKKAALFDKNKDFIEGLHASVIHVGEIRRLSKVAIVYRVKRMGDILAIAYTLECFDVKSQSFYDKKSMFVGGWDCIANRYNENGDFFVDKFLCCCFWDTLNPLESSRYNFIYPGAWQRGFVEFTKSTLRIMTDEQTAKNERVKKFLIDYLTKAEDGQI